MFERDLTGELCALDADLKRATELMRSADFSKFGEFSARIRAAAQRMQALGVPGRLSVADKRRLKAQMGLLNVLFNNASAFYRGWGALAAVSENDRLASTISLEG
jgi:hypothetical protein